MPNYRMAINVQCAQCAHEFGDRPVRLTLADCFGQRCADGTRDHWKEWHCPHRSPQDQPEWVD